MVRYKGTVVLLQEERVQSGRHAGTTGHASGMPGWLGTWTKRQVHYRRQPPPSLPARIPGTPQQTDADARPAPKPGPAEQPRNGYHPSAAASPPPGAPPPDAGAAAAAESTTEMAPPPNNVAEPVLTERERRAAALARAASEGGANGRGGMARKGSGDALADDEEGLRQEAWRWRFNQRWAQEQVRALCLPAAALCPAQRPLLCCSCMPDTCTSLRSGRYVIACCSCACAWWQVALGLLRGGAMRTEFDK